MPRPIEIADVTVYRFLQCLRTPVDCRQSRQGHSENDVIGDLCLADSVDANFETIGTVGKRLNRSNMRVQTYLGVDFIQQSMDDFFVTTDDGINVHIAIDVHQDVLAIGQPIGLVGSSRKVAVRHGPYVATGGFVLDRLG